MKAQHSIRNSIYFNSRWFAGMPSAWQSKRCIWPTQPTRSSLPCKSIPCDAWATGRNLPVHANSQWNHWLMGGLGGWGFVLVLSKKWKQTSTKLLVHLRICQNFKNHRVQGTKKKHWITSAKKINISVNCGTMILFSLFQPHTFWYFKKRFVFSVTHLSFAPRGDTKVPNSRISRKRRPAKMWGLCCRDEVEAQKKHYLDQ